MRVPAATVFVAVAVVAIATPAGAEPLSRSTAIAIALQQNPQVAAARARVAQAHAQKDQADAARWPQFTLELGVGPSLKATLVEGTAVQSTETSFSDLSFDDISVVLGGRLNIVQPLYTFGKIDYRREAADHGVAARQAQTDMTRAEIALEVARLYEAYLFARDASLFFEEVDHWLVRTIHATRERIANGLVDVSEQDVFRLESALGAAHLGMNHARAGVRQAEAGLRAYLGFAETMPFAVSEHELAPVATSTAPVATLAAEALRHRPELRALSEGAAAFGKLADAETAGSAPDFFLFGFVSGAYTPGRDFVDTRFVTDPLNHFTPGILLGARWQWQAGMAAGRADEQRAQAHSLNSTSAWVRNAVPAQVRKAYDDAHRAHDDITSLNTAVNQAKKWSVHASADYNAGLAHSRDVTDAISAYVQLRTALIEARYRHNVAMAELAHATGTLHEGSRLYPGKGK